MEIDIETKNQLKQTANIGNNSHMNLPLLEGVQSTNDDPLTVYINNV